MAAKALRLSLTASSTSADHQALWGRLMRPKGMEDLAVFGVKRKKEQLQRKEKETSIPLQKDSESRSKRQSHPSELSEN